MKKNIMIPLSLFYQLHMFFIEGDERFRDQISAALEKKMESLERHIIYSQSKTADTEAEREAARKEYLKFVGVPDDFRY